MNSIHHFPYYCNGDKHCNINRLQQVVQNSLVRTVCQAPRSASATELRRQLHWLPVRHRISYHHLQDTFHQQTSLPLWPPTRLPTSLNITIIASVPRMALAFSAKAFSVSAPSVWNSLLYQCWSAELFSSFRHILKTELFDIAYSECKQSA